MRHKESRDGFARTNEGRMSDACGLLKNIAMQLVAAGQIPGIPTARAIIRRLAPPAICIPGNAPAWKVASERFGPRSPVRGVW
ncbi:MAG: hypothetical protein NTY46_13450 [Candidatus Sumerlaeota bacterium]|nr:hypothetical protein [Candidatus Sumerlaeota bacterium]